MKDFKVFEIFIRVSLVFGKIINLLLQKMCAFKQFFIAVNAQLLNKQSSHLVTLAVPQ